jgi:UDP-glucuronate 4-epimerase
MRVLVTGTAGFIGFHVAARLLDRGDEVIGVDNINDYYDQKLKYARLKECGIEAKKILDNLPIQSGNHDNYSFVKLDLSDGNRFNALMDRFEGIDCICHLAAQAGVRYSLVDPHSYITNNIVAFQNILEACRHKGITNLVFASSSSVYGMNTRIPFSAEKGADHPVSLYAASKRANELMGHTYSGLFGIRATGLRFFTAYGPWGRPDMALFKFVRNIIEDRPIEVYNYGHMERDFTYIDDVAEGVIRVIDRPAEPDGTWNAGAPKPSSSTAPFRLYNLGRGEAVPLMEFISVIEKKLGRTAQKQMLPMQPGDVPKTYADTSSFEKDFEFKPSVSVQEGVSRFVDWYRSFYGIS